MTKVLLTGYTGFVGKCLLSNLQEDSAVELTLLGRQKHDIESHFFANIDADSNYSEALAGCDVVIHCAARVHVMKDSAADPLAEFRAVNTEGTLNLARQAAAAGVKRLIFLSSVKVNGETTTGRAPFTAADEPAPIDPYGRSKAEAESQLMALAEETGMAVVIIRPPLVYGEGVKANFASLMKLVGKGLPLPFGAIKQNKRSMVSVYNLVDLIKVCVAHPAAANKIFLVSDDNDLSTAELIQQMAKVLNKRNLSIPVPAFLYKAAGSLLRKNDMVDRLTGSLQVDIANTKDALDWMPPYSVEEGFALTAKSMVQKND